MKRDAELDVLLFDESNENKLNNLTHRERRDTLNHVDTLIFNTKNKIRGLQVSFKNALKSSQIKLN